MAGKVNLSASGITGTLPIAKGGTGLTSVGADGYVLSSDGSGALEYTPPAAGSVKSLANYYVDVANTDNSLTELINYTIPANTFASVGDKLNLFAAVHIDDTVLLSGTVDFKTFFDVDSEEDPIQVFSSGNFTEDTNWVQLRIEIVRTGSDTAKMSTILSRMENILECAELDEVDFSQDISLLVTGQSTTNDADVFTLKQGSVTLTKAPGGNVVGSNGVVLEADNTFTGNNTFENGVLLENRTTPSTPSTGHIQVYAKNDSLWIIKDDTTTVDLGAGSGGGDTSIISATLPSSSVNDYEPAGIADALVLILDMAQDSTITGLTQNAAKTLKIKNTSDYSLTLKSNDTSSSSSNRFFRQYDLDVVVSTKASVVLFRNTDEKWQISHVEEGNGYVTHHSHQVFSSACGPWGQADVVSSGPNTFTGTNDFQNGLTVSGGDATIIGDVHAFGYVTALTTKNEGDSPYYATTSDSTIIANPAVGTTLVVNLPSAASIPGRIYTFKLTGLGMLVIDGDGTETIDGVETKTLVGVNESVVVQSDGTNWVTVVGGSKYVYSNDGTLSVDGQSRYLADNTGTQILTWSDPLNVSIGSSLTVSGGIGVLCGGVFGGSYTFTVPGDGGNFLIKNYADDIFFKIDDAGNIKAPGAFLNSSDETLLNVNFGGLMSPNKYGGPGPILEWNTVEGVLIHGSGSTTAAINTYSRELNDSPNGDVSINWQNRKLIKSGGAVFLDWENDSVAKTTASNNDLADLTASVSSIEVTQAPDDGNDHTYTVGGYIKVNSATATTVTLQITYTDEASSTQTLSLFPQGLTAAAIATTGTFLYPSVAIRAKFNTAITLKSTISGTTINYDVGGYISKIN